MKPDLIVIAPLDAGRMNGLRERYAVHDASDPKRRRDVVSEAGAAARAVVTSGSRGLSADEMRAMPNLEIVCAIGAGTEGIDRDAARQRNIVVTDAGGSNAATVADHALALLFALVRDIPRYDRSVREGRWKESGEQRPILSGKKLGIVGLGRIGTLVAQRAAAFAMEVGYFSRSRRDGAAFQAFDTAHHLAEWCDFLVLSCPGGPATRHLVNAEVLRALGPAGFLVNVARGSVVDTEALVQALDQRIIAGAALDVIEGEPDIPPAVLQARNLILTPHIAGRSPEAIQASAEAVLSALERHFAR